MPTFDEKDKELLTLKQAALDAKTTPTCGDFVIYDDGRVERISYVWPDTAQTSPKGWGSYYLLDCGSCSYSGSLNPGVPLDKLIPTDIRRSGDVWFFHHELQGAGNGVYTTAIFKVWKCMKDT